jgi:hypothetical protein
MKPTQVVDCQADLLVRLQDPVLRGVWRSQLTEDIFKSLHVPTETAKANAAAYMQSMDRAMKDADAYHVSEDMTNLVVHAASLLDETDRMSRQLAPSRSGLVRFEQPLPMRDIRGKQLSISWMGWGPVLVSIQTRHDVREPQEAMCVWMWNDHQDAPDEIALTLMDPADDPRLYEFSIGKLGRWGFIGGETVYDNMRLGPAYVEADEARRAAILADGDIPVGFTNPLRYLHALWMLLGQTVVNVEERQLDRPYARRAKRMNLPRRVTVIELRRREGRRQPGETMVEWNHRWVVKGHWRWQQYGPRRHEHAYGPVQVNGRVLVRECDTCDARIERIWIDPFVKGPDGKPLIVTDKVYALMR